MNLLEAIQNCGDKKYRCFVCGGDGKETCTNPDHGFISALSFHDIGRLGCPVCGHHLHHKVKNGGDCDCCNGTGKLSHSEFLEQSEKYGFDDYPECFEIVPPETVMAERAR